MKFRPLHDRVEGSIVVGKVLANKSASYGFDAQKEEYVDMLSAGIVDPAKVVRVALQDAASGCGALDRDGGNGRRDPEERSRTGNAGRRRHGRNGFLIV